VAVGGDGLQDQPDLDIRWDASAVPDGTYTIYARSRSHQTGQWGPVDSVEVTVGRSRESSVRFSEDDHRRIETYPGPAIAEITSPSTGDVLGTTDVEFTPPEAYMGVYWANVTYVDGVMHIRGKSYDPRPYGNTTDIEVRVENEAGETVFFQRKNATTVHFDCEVVTGNRPLGGGRAGGLHYLPSDFERVLLWPSSGNFTGQGDVIDAVSAGCGFAFFFGHSAPNTLIVNLPGMPGGFSNSDVIALQPINLGRPVFPMDALSNGEKLPVVAVLGCHNSQFNVSLLRSVVDWGNALKTWTYGYPTLECWSWWLTRVEGGGAIATIGCTGLGYGSLTRDLVPDTGCWLFPEFFRQYGVAGQTVLGAVHGQALVSYLDTFGYDDIIDVKTVEEFALFGDPSLMIGGRS
jgi:hypothetical protein